METDLDLPGSPPADLPVGLRDPPLSGGSTESVCPRSPSVTPTTLIFCLVWVVVLR